jgi:hypothetical protein
MQVLSSVTTHLLQCSKTHLHFQPSNAILGRYRDECTSGVPPRLPDASSFRRRAANKLCVEATASAWYVVWYICQEKMKKISVTTKTNEDYANILDHPSLSRSSRPNLRPPQEIFT